MSFLHLRRGLTFSMNRMSVPINKHLMVGSRRTYSASTVIPVENLSDDVIKQSVMQRAKLLSIKPEEKAKFSAFYSRTGITFNDSRNLVLAVTVFSEEKSELLCKEEQDKLIVLGRALVYAKAISYVYKLYPNVDSLELTSMAQAYTSFFTLRETGRLFGLQEMIRKVNGKSLEIQSIRDSLLSNASSAFIGSIYIDQGEEAANKFIETFILSRELDSQAHINTDSDIMKQLSQITTSLKLGQPVARIIKETGRFSKTPLFLVGVFCGDVEIGRSYGNSIQMATTLAYKASILNYRLFKNF